MAILSTNQRLINVGDSYSAGNGIDITNNIISVTGDSVPYSAGDNIDIQDHIISGKDWSNDIEQASANAYNVTTAWVQDNYANSADMSYISAMVDTKLDTSAWSSVSGDLATESYVIMADNITYERAKGYVDSKGFATEEFVNENTSGKLDSTAFDTWQQGQYTNDIASLNNLIGTKLDASSFEETSGTFYPTSNPSGFITGVDLSNYYTKDETSGKEELANAFANIPVGDPEVNAYVHNNSASIDESTDLVQSNSSNWNDVTAYQSNSANYITAHQDISNLMPKSESANFYPMTGNPSGFINTLPEEEEVEFEEINLSSFATSSQINDLSAAIDYVSANAGDEFPASADEAIQCVQSNSSNWQSVSNKLDSDVFTAWSANQASNNYQLSAGDGISIIDDDINKITRIDCTAQGGNMFTAYLEYNDQNQISGYAGSAFAGQGGGGNPEVENYVQTNSAQIDETVTSYQTNSGTFLTAHQAISANEWNGCYDNVNTNSGAWGGSALPISAGPGIDVQLVNDTLVFSAVPNETVLWEGTAFTPAGSEYPTLTSVTLNESITNFNQIRLDFSGGNIFSESVVLSNPEVDENRWAWYNLKKEQSDNLVYIGTMYKFTNETTLSGKISYGDNVQNILAMTGGDWGYGGVVRVVGINRK